MDCGQNMGLCTYFPVHELRSAILGILKLYPASLVMLAPDCSSFSFLCSSTSQRFWFQPLGDVSRDKVAQGNLMATRCSEACTQTALGRGCVLQCVCALCICWMVRVTILVHLAVSLGHCVLIEQPGSVLW